MSRHEKAADLKGNRTMLRKRALVAACSVALFANFAIQAQEAPVDQAAATDAQKTDAQKTEEKKDVETLGTVKVTGIRHSVATSLETKNESNSIVEAVSAEDIGKLPDISIADSISRLPGITSQRVNGRAQVLAIRGLDENFATTLLNGREMVSTGNNRGVEFDQFPAELMSGVTVYKTPDGALVGQGLSGTVDLQTIRPLAYGERRIVLNARGEYNGLGNLAAGGDDKGYRGSVSYVDQFADGKFGVALGYARLSSPFQEQHYKAWWWANTDVWGQPQAGKDPDAIASQGAEVWVKSRQATRDGLMGVLEFKPNDNFHSVLDLYYSKFKEEEIMHGVMWDNNAWGGSTYSDATYSDINGKPVLTGGTLNNVPLVIRNDHNNREDKIEAVGWNNVFSWEKNSLTLDLNYSRATRDTDNLETYAGLLAKSSFGFNIPVSPNFPRYSMPNLADTGTVYLSDPAGWGHDGRLDFGTLEDKIKGGRLQFHHDVESDWLPSYDVGFNVTDRTKEKGYDVLFANLLNGRAPTTVDPSLLQSASDLGFAGVGNTLTYDPYDLLSRYYTLQANVDDNNTKRNFSIDETVKTYFFRANLDMEVGKVRIRGNAGVQYVRSEQSSTGPNGQNNNFRIETISASYGDILPSLNLVFDFGDGWFMRFGHSKTLARPRIDYLSAASNAGVSMTTGQWSGDGGNPQLQPYRAIATDLSLEKYFGPASYVSAAVFYKDLQTYVYQRSIQNYDFSDYTNTSGIPATSNFGTFYTWDNGEGGYMRGVELSGAIEGGLIHPALEGFGAIINGSYTESSIKSNGPDTPETDTLPGLSKIAANATLYYERHGFSARISHRYRSKYRGEYNYLFNDRSVVNTMNERQTDLQLGYEFSDESKLRGLSVLLQVNNLDNSPFRSVQSVATDNEVQAPLEYNEYGRQYLLGLTYKF